MGLFGWSYPAGCNGTPYDEEQAVEIKVPGVSADIVTFWLEDGTVEVVYNPGADDEKTVFIFKGEDEQEIINEVQRRLHVPKEQQ